MIPERKETQVKAKATSYRLPAATAARIDALAAHCGISRTAVVSIAVEEHYRRTIGGGPCDHAWAPVRPGRVGCLQCGAWKPLAGEEAQG